MNWDYTPLQRQANNNNNETEKEEAYIIDIRQLLQANITALGLQSCSKMYQWW